MQPVDSCEFEDFPAVIPSESLPQPELSGNYLVNLGETTITAALAIKVEGVSLEYVAYSGAIAVVKYNVMLVYYGYSSPPPLYTVQYNRDRILFPARVG